VSASDWPKIVQTDDEHPLDGELESRAIRRARVILGLQLAALRRHQYAVARIHELRTRRAQGLR